MESINEVKELLDQLAEEETSPIIAKLYQLGPPIMTTGDIATIENKLHIQIPESHQSLLLSFDWSNLRLGNMRFYSTAQEIIDKNSPEVNTLDKFYQSESLLEIGLYEADRICTRLTNVDNMQDGEIFFINHVKYPEIEAEFMNSSFERMIICAALDLQLKDQSDYYKKGQAFEPEKEESLFARIMEAILRVEPRAIESGFWNSLIRGY